MLAIVPVSTAPRFRHLVSALWFKPSFSYLERVMSGSRTPCCKEIVSLSLLSRYPILSWATSEAFIQSVLQNLHIPQLLIAVGGIRTHVSSV